VKPIHHQLDLGAVVSRERQAQQTSALVGIQQCLQVSHHGGLSVERLSKRRNTFNKAEGEAAIRSFEITQIKFISTISILSDDSEMLRASNRGK
jgi:septum formation inhibitor-activating ATPase MinD